MEPLFCLPHRIIHSVSSLLLETAVIFHPLLLKLMEFYCGCTEVPSGIPTQKLVVCPWHITSVLWQSVHQHRSNNQSDNLLQVIWASVSLAWGTKDKTVLGTQQKARSFLCVVCLTGPNGKSLSHHCSTALKKCQGTVDLCFPGFLPWISTWLVSR